MEDAAAAFDSALTPLKQELHAIGHGPHPRLLDLLLWGRLEVLQDLPK